MVKKSEIIENELFFDFDLDLWRTDANDCFQTMLNPVRFIFDLHTAALELEWLRVTATA